MRQRLQYLYLGHLTLPYLIAACARYWSENNQRAQYIHVSLKVVVASSPFVSTCMHVSNMSSHSYILYGSVCQLPATNETHSYTYLRYLSKSLPSTYLSSCMKIGECMKSGSSPALNLATVARTHAMTEVLG